MISIKIFTRLQKKNCTSFLLACIDILRFSWSWSCLKNKTKKQLQKRSINRFSIIHQRLSEAPSQQFGCLSSQVDSLWRSPSEHSWPQPESILPFIRTSARCPSRQCWAPVNLRKPLRSQAFDSNLSPMQHENKCSRNIIILGVGSGRVMLQIFSVKALVSIQSKLQSN